MVEVTVLYNKKTGHVKESLVRELKWYDDIRHEMLKFNGGKVGFEYKEDEYLVSMGEDERRKRGISSTYRMVPKIEDIKVINYNKIKTTTDEKDAKKWIDDYANYNIANISVVGFDDNGITVNLPNEELDDFLYQAERHGFRVII